MEAVSFNLLDERWIRVRDAMGKVQEVSLTEALIHAHTYAALAGELPTQDVAVLRLLLAVLHTVFSRVDAGGEERELDEDNALDAWQELWKAGRIPEEPVRTYLETWRGRFDLFDPVRPFYQVPEAKSQKLQSAARLNGEVSEPENKARLFSSRKGLTKDCLTFEEAARWLIYLNGFADIAVDPKMRKGLGLGWLGNLGLIIATGKNLFQTLMLNLTFLKDGNEPWGKNHPGWEEKTIHTKDRQQIPLPDNPAEMLTLQSWRIILERKGTTVIGYRIYGGDQTNTANAFSEQMTLWNQNRDGQYLPKKPDMSTQIWREFPSFAYKDGKKDVPGVIAWIGRLTNIIGRDYIVHFSITYLEYDDKRCKVMDLYHDELSFHAGVLDKLSRAWRQTIQDEIDVCNRFAYYVGKLAGEVQMAGGNIEQTEKGIVPPEKTRKAKQAKERYYHTVDTPFREWLLELDADQSGPERLLLKEKFEKKLSIIAMKIGQDMVRDAGDTAMTGRFVKAKNGKMEHYSAPEAFNRFVYRLNHLDKEG